MKRSQSIQTRRTERLVALFLLGVVLFNYPVLALFAEDRLLFGIPVLYLYLFTVWAALITATGIILRRPRPGRRTGDGG